MIHTVYVLNIGQKTAIENHNSVLLSSNKKVEPVRLDDSYIPIANDLHQGYPYTAGVWVMNTEVEKADYNGASAFLKTLATTEVDDKFFVKEGIV
jgi:hypothetical protein